MQQAVTQLKKLIELFDGNKAAFARAIRKAPAQVNQWITGYRSMGPGIKRDIEQALKLPAYWMDSTLDLEKLPQSSADVYQIGSVVRPDDAEVIDIPKSDAVASMGHGRPQPENESLADYVRVNKEWARMNFPGVQLANLAVLSAYGDSMSPTFNDGDTLIVDRGIGEIRIDAVYVLSLDDELYIKRLQRRPDGIMMISDNKNYQPYLIHNGEREKFSVLGRVIWAWTGKKI